MKARILSIENNKAHVALLDEKKGCSSGSCGGCHCSSGVKTMKIDMPENEEWKTGDLLLLHSHGAGFDAFLLIVIPLVSVGILKAAGLPVPVVFLSAGLLFFCAALFLRLFRGKKKLEIRRLEN